MKKVKLTCPTNAPIRVTPEHAERILSHPLNEKAKWKRAEDNQEKKKDAAGIDNNGNQGASPKEAQPRKDKPGRKPRGKAKTP